MQPPAPYSNSDTTEIESINTLRSLLDPRRVKADLRERDKFPNSDGYLELVDEQGHPCGKVEIQIKTIASTGTSCPCPGRLVGYSTVTSLPVILVGVDSTRARAYWAHVHPTMPEYKPSQHTFTIRFIDALDYVDATAECPCYHRWLELAREYQHRVRLPAAGSVPPPKTVCLTTAHVEALQRFIDAVNQLLDHDFATVKALLFPGIWKFGVGCQLVGHDLVHYQLLHVPKGRPTPLIVELPESVPSQPPGDNVQMAVTLPRDTFFGDPEQHGRKFVFKMLRHLIETRALPVRSAELAADVVFGFIRLYHRWLEIKPDRDEYHLEELRQAFGPRLARTAGTVAQKLLTGASSVREVNLDRDLPPEPPRNTLPSSSVPKAFRVYSTGFPIKVSFQSVALLSSLGVPSIRRRFRNPDREYLTPPNNYIWSCYSKDREIQNVTAILECVVSEYKAFIRGCAFHLEDSPYLDPSIAIVFDYVSSYERPAGTGPALYEYHLRNSNSSLPKTTVLSASVNRDFDRAQPLLNMVIGDVAHKVETTISRLANFFFFGTPLLHLIYELLADDLKRKYATDVHL